MESRPKPSPYKGASGGNVCCGNFQVQRGHDQFGHLKHECRVSPGG